MPKAVVLLLEDEALIALDLQAELESVGYIVAGPFETCTDALGWLAGNKPDCAVLDMVLKDGPSRDVALSLAERGVPLLVYSGHRQNVDALPECVTATWVEKPAPSHILLNTLAGLRSRISAAA